MPRALQPICRALALLLLLSLWMSAQQPTPQNTQPKPQNSPPQGPQQTQDQDQEPVTTLRRDVNVVNLFFNVRDKHSALIPDLTKPDFELYEDGKPQTIKYFSRESDLPLTLG